MTKKLKMLKIKIKKVADVKDSIYANDGDAGLDLRASGRWVINLDSEKKEIEQDSYELQPGERILIKTGVKMEIPSGFWGNIRDRSGLAFKNGLHVMAGVVDETYRGEIGVVMINLSKNSYDIKKNDRIAQMVISPYVAPNISIEDNLEESNRAENGFGSTGR